MTEKYDVYSEFDIDKHAEHFVNYLEVCISPDGKVHYAIPSHVQFLENVLKQQCLKNGLDYEKVINEHVADWPNCLCNLTGYISVWDDFIMLPYTGDIFDRQTFITDAQKETLFLLRTTHYKKFPKNTLYRGDLPF